MRLDNLTCVPAGVFKNLMNVFHREKERRAFLSPSGANRPTTRAINPLATMFARKMAGLRENKY